MPVSTIIMTSLDKSLIASELGNNFSFLTGLDVVLCSLARYGKFDKNWLSL